MGATVAVALITEAELAVANVGDTKVFEFAEGSLLQLSTDDTLEQTNRLPGLPTSRVTQALGGGRELIKVHPHLTVLKGGSSRKVLMCSDGLSDYVPVTEICAKLDQHYGFSAVEELVVLALNAGGRDNVTVLLVEVE